MSFFGKIKTAGTLGTIRTSNIIDFSDDPQGRSHETNPGYYAWNGKTWDGPAETLEEAHTKYVKPMIKDTNTCEELKTDDTPD